MTAAYLAVKNNSINNNNIKSNSSNNNNVNNNSKSSNNNSSNSSNNNNTFAITLKLQTIKSCQILKKRKNLQDFAKLHCFDNW